MPFDTFTDNFSYTAGVDFIRYLRDDNPAVNIAVAIQAIEDTLKDRKNETHADTKSYFEGADFGEFVIKVNEILIRFGLPTLDLPTIKRGIADALNGCPRIPLSHTNRQMKYFLEHGIPEQARLLAEKN